MRIESSKRLEGSVDLPGDKSISHRYGILGAISAGETVIQNFSSSVDCASTLRCVESLGVTVERRGNRVRMESPGWPRLRQPQQHLDAGNSGTTIRLLSGVLAGRPMLCRIGGDESLNRRPMARIIRPLSQMGAAITARNGEFPPLEIRGGELEGIRYELPVASAQVKSCLLLAGLTARGRTTVLERQQTRDHTERAIPAFGGTLEVEPGTPRSISLEGPQELRGAAVTVPGDLSSALYFVSAAILLPGSNIIVRRVGLNPTRTGMLKLLEEGGAEINRENAVDLHSEPVADLQVSGPGSLSENFPDRISGDLIPNLIDELPLLAVLATSLPKGLEVREAGELRKKESDRIHSVVHNLRAVGIDAVEYEDGFYVPFCDSVRGGSVETFGDHRIAMAFSILALISRGGIELDDPDCAAVSFPAFFEALSRVRT